MSDSIGADQVSHCLDAIWRYGETMKLSAQFPRCSMLNKAAETACFLEIIRITGLQFQDDKALTNAFVSMMPKTAEQCSNTSITPPHTTEGL